MEIKSVKYLVWIIGLMLFQIIVLNNLNYSDLIQPYAYIFIFLYIPRSSKIWVQLVFAFCLGLLFDIFSDTYGVHAFATTFIAYFRTGLLASLAPSDSSSEHIEPSFYTMGVSKYLAYASILVSVHHLLVCFVEIFEWNAFFRTLLRAIFSSIVTLLLISVMQLMFVRKEK